MKNSTHLPTSQKESKMDTLGHMIRQYEIVTDWYLSVLENISDEDGSKTVHERTNTLEWIAGHLIVGRYRNILRVGAKIEPYAHLDKFINQAGPPPNSISFDKNLVYPSLTESMVQWKTYSTIFLTALNSVNENILSAEIPFPVLTGGKTVMDALVFAVLHETYHIGQMSILRRSLGYGPMQLTRRKKSATETGS